MVGHGAGRLRRLPTRRSAQWSTRPQTQVREEGYFITDRNAHTAAQPMFNRITTLKDSWSAA